MNSGIGAHSTLSALGIPTVLDLPSVGQNASDQPLMSTQWAVHATDTFDPIRQNATRFAEGLAQWNASRTGPFVDSGTVTHLGWSRLAPDSPAFGVHADPSSGPDAPHLEFSFIPEGSVRLAQPLALQLAVVLTSSFADPRELHEHLHRGCQPRQP
jgi:choline dehydrogenase-like flavoprotein